MDKVVQGQRYKGLQASTSTADDSTARADSRSRTTAMDRRTVQPVPFLAAARTARAV